MIENFFKHYKTETSLLGGFISGIVFAFKLLKSMGKVLLALLILAAILYSVHYFNPELLESVIKSLLKRFN